MDDETAQSRILDATDRLFYEHGIRAVGMDAIRDASGVSLKRLYRLYPAKDQLAEATLRRRADAFHAALVATRPAAGRRASRSSRSSTSSTTGSRSPTSAAARSSTPSAKRHRGGVMRLVADQKHDFERLLDDLVAAAGGPTRSAGSC